MKELEHEVAAKQNHDKNIPGKKSERKRKTPEEDSQLVCIPYSHVV